MAVIKIYCSRCGQKVSGDESFYGTTVHCPVCSSEIQFPQGPEAPPVRQDGAAVIIPPPPSRPPAVAVAPAPVESAPAKPFAGGGVTTPMPRHPHQPVNIPPPVNLGPLPSPGLLPTAGPVAGHPLPAALPPPSGAPGAGAPGMPGLGALTPSAVPAAGPRTSEEEAEDDEDPGVMPMLVLVSGIASLVFCSGLLILSGVAIVGGHLTMMKLHEAGIKTGRGKVLAGTLMGYVSVVLFLALAIAAKLAWPALQKSLQGG